jgi:hypothetical protein
LEAISAEEWGRRVAAQAPQWSDEKWRRVCATLNVEVPSPEPVPLPVPVRVRSVDRAAA